MHELKFLPIPFLKVEVGIIFTFKIWDFVTLVRKLGKVIYGLYE